MATEDQKQTDTRQNIHKAALVLLSLPHRQRSVLLDRLDSRQADAVIAEMNAIDGRGEGAEQEAAMRDFAAVNLKRNKKPRPDKNAPFQFLHELDGESLLGLIAGEHPQTIAIVLAGLPPRKAAAALATMPPDEQLSVACRIAAENNVSPETVSELVGGLQRRLASVENHRIANRGISSLVRILNAMPPMAERSLLSDLAETEPDLAQEIRLAMFGPEIAAHHQSWDVAEISC